MSALTLRPLRRGDKPAFDAAIAAFAADDPGWDFAFHYDPAGDFAAYVDLLAAHTRGERLHDGWVPTSYFVGVVGDHIVGRLSLRHRLNDFLREYGGHIGYGVIPSARGRGYATAMLRASLPIARSVGIDRLLLTCSDDNAASIAVIERCGGILGDTRPRTEDDGDVTRRYWIDLSRIDAA